MNSKQYSQNKTIGIIGGGQLGRMLTEAAKNLPTLSSKADLKIKVLDPVENCPASQVGARQIKGSLTDADKIRELAEQSDFLTWEIEHINTEILEQMESEGYKINPSPKTLAKIKDKFFQKQFLTENGIPTAPFKRVDNLEDAKNAVSQLGLPMVLKTRLGGYDGRGNFVIRNEEDLEEGFNKLGGNNLYAEGWVDFEKELAVMAVRDIDANIKTYPVVQTIHENNILHLVYAPAPIPEEQNKQAEDFAKKVMEHLEGAGVFGIEMFYTKTGEILVNEIAPRVHNSGHYTIEACEASQFEIHLRAVSEMDLGDTSMKVGAAVMVNILGDRNGEADPKGIEESEKLGNVFVHIYGKKDVKPERKMGHITVVGESLEEVIEKANLARSLISI
jgi:phosphoribosylaminoimidazole carboxylase PurK protein